jgi:DNA-binding NarL/FixJ family response regulator
VTECIRRAGSEWTLCKCDTCRRDIRRKAKLARNGRANINDQRAAALQRLAEWENAGYSVGFMAQAAGIRKATLDRHIAGKRSQISHATARKIMAANVDAVTVGGFIPSVGTVRRLRALTVMGWSMSAIAERTGIKESTLHALRDPAHRFTRPMYAKAVADAYEALSMTHGGCRYAATRAVRKGWLPPLAWDDIDDPGENPQRNVLPVDIDEVAVERLMAGDKVPATRAERVEAVRRLTSVGRSDREVANLLRVTERTVLRWRAEFGIETRWAA